MNARGKDFGDIRDKDKDPPKPPGNKNLPGVNLQIMDGERPQKFRIGEIDRPGVLRKKFERFEQGPVLDVMAELRTVVNSVEGVPEHEARCALSERSGSGPWSTEASSSVMPNSRQSAAKSRRRRPIQSLP